MKIKLKKYDVIIMHKIHSNMIFNNIDKGLESKICLNKNSNGDLNCKFIKSRPAIVLSNLVQNENGDAIILVVPLTTKKSVNKINKNFRSPFNALGKPSYLMWDSIMRIDNKQIKCLYSKSGKIMNLSNSTKQYIDKEAKKKIYNWINKNS